MRAARFSLHWVISRSLAQPTLDEVAAVRDWLDGSEIAWIGFASSAAAKALEDEFKDEYKPPLTKR